MRRAGGLFSRVTAFDNLRRAAARAQAGKRYRSDVLAFNLRQEDELHRLARELAAGAWRPGPHRHFRVSEPKERWISAAPYRDRVVHHALCSVIEPEIDRGLIHDCWANRRGKGSHRAALHCQALAVRYPWVLKVDIQKYFPAIDHQILKASFRRRFKEPPLLALMDLIVDHGQVPEPFCAYFPGDDLFTPFERPKGLPIGNLTSQLWANLYLDSFDHWVKERLAARGTLRFVDDFLLFADSPGRLTEWRAAVGEQLAAVRLRPHPLKTVVQRTAEGVSFLGYVAWPERIRVRGETVRRYRRRLRRRLAGLTQGQRAERERSLAAWKGHVQLAGGFRRRTW